MLNQSEDIYNTLLSDDNSINLNIYKNKLQGQQRPYVFGYVRLSREGDKEKDSLSNQRSIIKDYALDNDYNLIDIIEDDGISGMTFDRQGISILKDLIDEKLIDIIIVKDLSRLGRHRTYSALFIDYLNQKDVKVISVTENIDTSNENDDALIGFKQILNEQYSRDLSKKIKAGMRQKQKDEGLVVIPPFGYIKNRSTNEIEIVEECADIVRLIYKLFIEENIGNNKIANYLTEQGYKTPSMYQKKHYNKDVPYNSTTKTSTWNDNTISKILRNDAYIGILRCNVETKSVINRTRRKTNEDEHIIHKGVYPTIIDQKTWDLAQSIIKNRAKGRSRNSANQKVHRYAGLLQCTDCKATFSAKRRKWKTNPYVEYVCNTYHRRGKQYCTSHRIREERLDDIIYSYLDQFKMSAEENLLKADDLINNWIDRKKRL